MLRANRFLTLSEIGEALRHYEKKVGMGHWYKDPGSQDEEATAQL